MIARTRRRLHRILHRHEQDEHEADEQPAEAGEHEADEQPANVTIDLTTEARWFFDDALPSDIHDWFTRDGSIGLRETRTDLYRIDQHVDLGLKRRSGTVLELKLQLKSPTPFSLDDEHDGMVERWQRWSPADQRVNLDERAAWRAVDKTVIKRRFGVDGRERVLTEADRAMTGQGCDVEIVAIRLEGENFWSFAFAAFGSLETHRRSLATAWETVQDSHRVPEQLRLDTSRSCGYPEWLNRNGQDPAVD